MPKNIEIPFVALPVDLFGAISDQLKEVGANAKAAKYSGVNVKRLWIIIMAISRKITFMSMACMASSKVRNDALPIVRRSLRSYLRVLSFSVVMLGSDPVRNG